MVWEINCEVNYRNLLFLKNYSLNNSDQIETAVTTKCWTSDIVRWLLQSKNKFDSSRSWSDTSSLTEIVAELTAGYLLHWKPILLSRNFEHLERRQKFEIWKELKKLKKWNLEFNKLIININYRKHRRESFKILWTFVLFSNRWIGYCDAVAGI